MEQVSIVSLWLPILLSAVIVFFAAFVASQSLRIAKPAEGEGTQ